MTNGNDVDARPEPPDRARALTYSQSLGKRQARAYILTQNYGSNFCKMILPIFFLNKLTFFFSFCFQDSANKYVKY